MRTYKTHNKKKPS